MNEDIGKMLEEKGKRYSPAILPNDIKRGPLKQCFDWSFLVSAFSKGKYRYVEGATLRPGTDNEWILHAWVTDEKGENAYDPTWIALDQNGKEVPMPTVYIGREMNLKAVALFMKTTDYQGVLANGWRAPELASKCLLD